MGSRGNFRILKKKADGHARRQKGGNLGKRSLCDLKKCCGYTDERKKKQWLKKGGWKEERGPYAVET